MATLSVASGHARIMQGIANSMFVHVGIPGSVTSSGLSGQKGEKENTMLALAIAMGTVVWAMIGYALLSPNPPALEGTDADANV
jgi:hypothetical protein